jgi:hypothetical protein
MKGKEIENTERKKEKQEGINNDEIKVVCHRKQCDDYYNFIHVSSKTIKNI